MLLTILITVALVAACTLAWVITRRPEDPELKVSSDKAIWDWLRIERRFRRSRRGPKGGRHRRCE